MAVWLERMTSPVGRREGVASVTRKLPGDARTGATLALLWMRRHTVMLIVAGLLLWVWAMFFAFSIQHKRQLLDDRVNALGLMASAVGQHTAGLLGAVETSLREVDTWLVTHPGADPLRDPRFLALVGEMRRSRGGLTDIRLVSTTGQAYWLPAFDGKPRAEVGDREYFTYHQSGPGAVSRAMHINAPVESRVDKRWYLPISMRLSPQSSPMDPSARDASPPMLLLYATIALEQLAGEQHEAMRFRPNGTITLMREDGILLSRAPMSPAFLGRDFSRSVNYAENYGAGGRGSFVSDGVMTDGVTRLVGYERLRDYPVSVMVSRSYDDVLAMFYSRFITALVLNGLLTTAVIWITVVSVRSRREATTDELTGVMNRRAFLAAAQHEFQRARRYGRPTAVMMLDIDHFKLVNDKYGHADGDLVLRGCAARWQAALRDQDLLGRIGGEEFCILLPETGPAQALLIAERLRLLTGASAVLGGHCTVTVSVGWTVLDANDLTWQQMLARADQAVYAAKKGGRDRVASSVVDVPVPLPINAELETAVPPR